MLNAKNDNSKSTSTLIRAHTVFYIPSFHFIVSKNGIWCYFLVCKLTGLALLHNFMVFFLAAKR